MTLFCPGGQEDLGAGVRGQDRALAGAGGSVPAPGGVAARGRGGVCEDWTLLWHAECRV